VADHDPSSTILSGVNLNVVPLLAEFSAELPVWFNGDGHTSFSYAPGGSTSFSTMDTISLTVESDEAVVAISTGCWSSSNTSHTWYLRHNISGETLNVERQVRVTCSSTSTAGVQQSYTVVTVFSSMSGAKTLNLEVGNSDSGPTSTFYSNVGNTYTFQLKKRSA
jgi:hypothetical protein